MPIDIIIKTANCLDFRALAQKTPPINRVSYEYGSGGTSIYPFQLGYILLITLSAYVRSV